MALLIPPATKTNKSPEIPGDLASGAHHLSPAYFLQAKKSTHLDLPDYILLGGYKELQRVVLIFDGYITFTYGVCSGIGVGTCLGLLWLGLVAVRCRSSSGSCSVGPRVWCLSVLGVIYIEQFCCL